MVELFARAVQVECYSGYTYAQEPRAVIMEGQQHEILRITARWRTPSGPAFRIETSTGPHILQYDETMDVWTLASPAPAEGAEEQSGGEDI